MAGGKGIRAGKAYTELGTDDSKMAAGFKKASNRLRAFGRTVGMVGSQMAKVGAVAMAPLLGAAKVFSSMGDNVAKMARRTGVSVEALSELNYVAGQSGASVTALETAFKTMARGLTDAGRGSGEAMVALDELGMSVADLAGMKPDQQFKLLADRLAQVKDPSAKAAMAMKLFGKSGTDLLPMLDLGATGIEDLQKHFRDLGGTMSSKAAKAAEEFTDAMDDATQVAKKATFEIGMALAPALKDFLGGVVKSMQGITEWVKAHQGAVVTTLKVTAAVVGLGVALMTLGKIVTLVSTIMKASLWLTAHPVVLAIAAIGVAALAAATALGVFKTEVKDTGEELERLHRASARQRDLDKATLARLAALAEKQRLNSEEVSEARDLIFALERQYGKLGLSLDMAAGKLDVAAEASKRMRSAMRAEELREVTEEFERAEEAVVAYMSAMASGGRVTKEMHEAYWKYGEQLREIETRLRALTSEAGTVHVEETSRAEPEWARKVHVLKLQMIGDEHARAIALIDAEYDYDIARLRERGASQATIDKAMEAQMLERAKLEQSLRRGAAKGDQARIESAQELWLRTQYEGLALELQMLALQERRALAAAKAAGENLDLVRQEFDLKEKLAKQGAATMSGMESRVNVVVNSNALRSLRPGNVAAANRTAVATEAMRQDLRSLYQYVVSGGGQVFS